MEDTERQSEPAGVGDHSELEKWRSRVPKLAAALRERNEQIELLEARLKALEGGAAVPAGGHDGGIRARDQLIEELEGKLSELTRRYREAEGSLRSMELEIADLTSDRDAWRRKWQQITESLDTHDARVAEDEHQIEQLRAEADSLRQRNEQLFETTEFTHRQLDGLGGELAQLRAALKASERQLRTANAENEDLTQRLHGDQALREQTAAELQGLQKRHERLETAHARKLDELQAAQSACADHASALEETRRALETARAALEDSRAELVERSRQADELTQRLSQAERNRASLAEGLDDAERLRRSAEAERDRMAAQFAGAQEHMKTLAAERDQARTGVGDQRHRMEALTAENQNLADRQAAMSEELKRHQSRSVAERAELLARAEVAEAALEEERSLLPVLQAEAFAALDLCAERMGTLQSGLTASQAAGELLLADAADLERDCVRASGDLESAREGLDKLECQLADAESALEQHALAASVSGGEHDDQLNGLATRLAENERALEDARAACAAAVAERDELSRRLADAGAGRSEPGLSVDASTELLQALEAARAEIDALGERLDRADSERESLSASVQDAAMLNDMLETTVTAARSEVEAKAVALQAQNELISTLRREVAELGGQIDAAPGTRQGDGESAGEDTSPGAAAVGDRRALIDRLEQRLAEVDGAIGEQLVAHDQHEQTVIRMTDELTRASHALSGERGRRVELEQQLGGGATTVRESLTDVQAQMKRLQNLLAERTRELNDMRWENSVADTGSETDERTMLVLNQQLKAARHDNDALMRRVAELEAAVGGEPDAAASPPGSRDDLTRIRGIGPKLAAQLQELGIDRLSQIAEIREDRLVEENHLLHEFQNRIVRDEWVRQATDLLG